VTLTKTHAVGLLAVVMVVGAAFWPSRDVGYVQINTVPAAPITQAGLYLDATKLAPIHQDGTLLRQPIGKLKLQAETLSGERVAICDIVVKRNRITTVTVSVLERPPRCLCRFTGSGDPRTIPASAKRVHAFAANRSKLNIM
jgi:hypothetical protein